MGRIKKSKSRPPNRWLYLTVKIAQDDHVQINVPNGTDYDPHHGNHGTVIDLLEYVMDEVTSEMPSPIKLNLAPVES